MERPKRTRQPPQLPYRNFVETEYDTVPPVVNSSGDDDDVQPPPKKASRFEAVPGKTRRMCACPNVHCTDRVACAGDFRKDCAYRIENGLQCDGTQLPPKTMPRFEAVPGKNGTMCACPNVHCRGRVARAGNFRKDCAYRIENGLEIVTAENKKKRLFYGMGGHTCSCPDVHCTGRVARAGDFVANCAYRIENGLALMSAENKKKQALSDERHKPKKKLRAQRHYLKIKDCPIFKAARRLRAQRYWLKMKDCPVYKAKMKVRLAKRLVVLQAERRAIRKRDRAWLDSLPRDTWLAVKAYRKACRAARGRIWGGSFKLAKIIVEYCAAAFPEFAHLLRTTPPVDANGEPLKSWLKVKAAPGASVIHATNVAPDKLKPVNGVPFMLEPRDHYNRGKPHLAAVWGSGSGCPDKAMGFVNAHLGKRFIEHARDDPENHALYLYFFQQEHPQYEEFQQMFFHGRLPPGNMQYFAKCREPVNVARGTPGLTILKLTWPDGPTNTVVTDVYA